MLCFSRFSTWLRISRVPNPLLANMPTTAHFIDPCSLVVLTVSLLCLYVFWSWNCRQSFSLCSTLRLRNAVFEWGSQSKLIFNTVALEAQRFGIFAFSQTCLMVIPCWQCSPCACTFYSIEQGSQKVHRCVRASSSPRSAGASGLRCDMSCFCMLCFMVSPCI